MRSWRIATFGTTDVRIHPALPLCFAYAALTGHGMFMVISLLSILLHEGAHTLVAVLFGQAPTSVELTPLGAVMRLEDEGRLSRFPRMLMLLAGPAATLIICWMAVHLTAHEVLSGEYGRLMFMTNLSILILNLLPVLPLDGGRVLSLLLEKLLPLRIARKTMRTIGCLIGVLLIALNIYASLRLGGWNLSLAFAGCCMLYTSSAATTTQAASELRYFMDRKIRFERKGRLHTRMISARADRPLRSLVRSLPASELALFACIEPGTLRMLGFIHEGELIQQYLNRPGMSLSEALRLCKTGPVSPNTTQSEKVPPRNALTTATRS